MKKHLFPALVYTLATAAGLGIIYPLVITGIAHLAFPEKANGQLIYHHQQLVGSSLIGQSFTGPAYFHSRPSAAGTGYDAGASSGSNLAPSSKALGARVDAAVASEQQDGDVPVDLVTTSGSGLDPDISPASALYQVMRVAKERHLPEDRVRALVNDHIVQRQFGLLGEPRVNVLQLNLALNELAK